MTNPQNRSIASARHPVDPARRAWANFPFASPGVERRFPPYPLISVVLPVYNQARFITSAIESVLAERRYPVELILVNDGSTDHLSEVIAPFRRHSAIQVIDQQNSGIAAALTNGFRRASGDFWTWTSADNRYLAGALGSMADFLIANPSIGFVYGDIQLIDDSGAPVPGSSYRGDERSAVDPSWRLLPCEARTLWQLSDNFINACFLYRRRYAELLGPFEAGADGYEDYAYWLGLSSLTSFAHHDSEPRYQYRLHEESLTARLRTDQLRSRQLDSVVRAAKRHSLSEMPCTFTLRFSADVPAADRTVLRRIVERCGRCAESVDLSDSVWSGRARERSGIGTGSERFVQCELIEPVQCRREFLFAPCACVGDQAATESGETVLRMFGGFSGFLGPSRTCCVPPLLGIPELIVRARDRSHGAVTRAAGTAAAILVFPESAVSGAVVDRFRDLIEQTRSITWVMFCGSPNERKTAQMIREAVRCPDRVSVLDFTQERWCRSDEYRNALTDEPLLQRSLMYALSSVDGVASVQIPSAASSSPARELRLLIELALSAAARRSLLHFELPEDISANGSDNRAVYSEFHSTAPHIRLVRNETSEHSLLDWIMNIPEVGSVEQWRTQFSPKYIANEIRRVLISGAEIDPER